MGRYNTLRIWSQTLIMIGIISMALAGFGVLAWAIEVDGFWPTLGVVLLGGPFVVFLASWPLAIGQLMRAIAGIGDSVDVLTPDRPGAGLS
jgi:hypothetical protein